MKSLRPVFLISVFIAIIAMASSMFFMFAGPDRIQLAGKSLKELIEGGELLGVIAVPVMLIIFAVVMVGTMRNVMPARIKNGITAPARVLQVRDTGVSINDNPQVGLTVEVTPPGRAPFQAEVKTIVSRLNAALVQPGLDVQVVYDPQNPKRIQVQELQFGSAPLSDAESRLKELDRLYEQRLITGEEYRAKREEIIKKI